ncbi:MAG: hypothetical protein ACETWE_00985 [Candidatus Bathyarchaeia archaeon]
MENVRKVAEKYASAMKALEDVKRDLSDAIIKYIIANSYRPKTCTETAIVEALGIPRSTIRRVLADLTEEEPVLKVEDYGTIKPYSLEGIGYAIDRNYVSFSRKEIRELLTARELPERVRDEPTLGHPQVQMDLPDGKTVVRYRGPAADLCLERLIQRFYGYMATDLDEKLARAYGEQTSRELTLLAPEMQAFEKTVRPHTLASFLGGVLSKELMGIDPDSSLEEIKELLKAAVEAELQYVQKRLESFAQLLDDKGYKGTLDHFKDHIPSEERYVGDYPPFDYHFRNEYLWATTLALREGCIVAEKIGADLELLQRLRKLADALDISVEENYQGKEKAGLSLEEWFDKRAAG